MATPPIQAANDFKQQGYERRDLRGHTKPICALSWPSNGRRLATGSQDTSIRIWSIDPFTPPSRHERSDELRGHSGMVAHLAWKPDSDTVLASVAGDKNDKSLRLWDVKSMKATSVVSLPNSPLYVTWSPDGTTLAALDNTNALTFVDARKGKVVRTHRFQSETFEIEWGPTPQHMLMASQEGCVNVVSLTTMEPLWSLVGHTAYCGCFATSHDFKYLVSGGADALVALWDLDDATCVRTWAHMDGVVRSVSISHDKAYVAYTTDSRECEIVGLRTGERLQDIPLRATTDCVAWSPKHNVLAWLDEENASRYDSRTVGGLLCIYAPAREQ